MQRLIMDMPRMISAAIRHVADHRGKTEVVALAIEGDHPPLRPCDRARAHAATGQRLAASGRASWYPPLQPGLKHASRVANVRGYSTSTETIDKLCRYFKCQVSDVANYIEDESLSVGSAPSRVEEPDAKVVAPKPAQRRRVRTSGKVA